MKRQTLLYIPLLLLFVFAAATLIAHFAGINQRFGVIGRDFKLPFSVNRTVSFVAPSAAAEGLAIDDKIVAMNGRPIASDADFIRESAVGESGQPMPMTIERKTADGATETHQMVVTPVRLEKDLNFYSRIFVGFLFEFMLPALCVLLGFWVVLVRPQDYLAWLLLFLLFGIGSIGIEGYGRGTINDAFRDIFGSSWSLSMLLFGIYFPERIGIDKKLPWLKFIFIVPLGFQIFATILEQLKVFTGLGLVDALQPLIKVYEPVSTPLNFIAIALFFGCLGWKSGTLENADARRRLKLMVFGTSVAMTPAFAIILYSIVTRSRGSFFDVAPSWLALISLFLTLMFPVTMAYVIVVQRAMDVSVVVRQGLQYALAKGGVRVLQLILLLVIGLGVRHVITNYGSNNAAQIAIIIGGVSLVPLIEYIAKPLRVWIDKKFFRERYNSEQLLSELSDDVRTMVETKPMLETLSARLSESLHVPQVALLLREGSTFQPAYALGYATPPNAFFREDAPTIVRLNKNEPVVIYDEDDESLSAMNGDREQLRALNSQLLLPVGAKDVLSGVISLGPKLSEEPYSANDIRLLRSVASQTGLALENSRLTEAIAYEAVQKERINREIEIAREVQERLFPQELPHVAGLEYYGACRPASGVGGDYYDFFELDSGKFGIAIGDVSGKGIGASLMMASLQASLRGQAIHSGDDLAGLMVHVNKLVYETSTTNRYATFFYAQYEPSTRKLVYVNAGHNPPFLLRRGPSASDTEVILLTEGGPVVGMLPPMIVRYSQGEIVLQPGDMLVGSTDGITEAMNPNDDEWGEDSMLEELKKVYGLPSREVLEYIVAAADKFADGAKQHDDMTMIVVNVQ